MPSMWMFSAPRSPPPMQPSGPAILAAPDGATPRVQFAPNCPGTRKRGLEWLWTLAGRNRQPRPKTDPGGELQIMLPNQGDLVNSGEVCLLAESPYRILRVNFDENIRNGGGTYIIPAFRGLIAKTAGVGNGLMNLYLKKRN